MTCRLVSFSSFLARQMPEILADPIELPPPGVTEVRMTPIDPTNPSPLLASHQTTSTTRAMGLDALKLDALKLGMPPMQQQVGLAAPQHAGVLPEVGHPGLITGIAGPPPHQYQHLEHGSAMQQQQQQQQPQQQQYGMQPQQYGMQPGGAHLALAHRPQDHQDRQQHQDQYDNQQQAYQAYQQAYHLSQLTQYQQHDYELQSDQHQPQQQQGNYKEVITAPRPPTVAG